MARTKTTYKANYMVVDHSVLIACVVGVCFFFIFFWGTINLGRERLKARDSNHQ